MTANAIANVTMLSAGMNDTVHAENRAPNQAADQRNFRVRSEDGALETIPGRLAYKNDLGSAGQAIHGLTVPPTDIPLAVFTTENNTLIVKAGDTNPPTTKYSARIAAGNYYTYAELAAALQGSVAAGTGIAGALGANFTVAVTYSASKFNVTITRAVGYYSTLCWKYPRDVGQADTGGNTDWTTLDPGLFGFRWSVKCASEDPAQSEWTKTTLPPRQRKVAVGGTLKTYDGSNEAALTYPDGSVPALNAGNRWDGAWNNKRHYSSDGLINLVCRDQYVRRAADVANIEPAAVTSATAVEYLYNHTPDCHGTRVGLSYAARVTVSATAASVAHLINYIEMFLTRPTSLGDHGGDIKFYIEAPSIGEMEEFHHMLFSDITASAIFHRYLDTPAGSLAPWNLVIMMDNYVADAASQFQYAHLDTEDSGLYETLHRDGYWEPVNHQIYLVLAVNLSIFQNLGLISGMNYSWKAALETADGEETQLTDFDWNRGNTSCEHVTINFHLRNYLTMDWEFFNLYRTEGYVVTAPATVYRLVGRLSRAQIAAAYAAAPTTPIGIDDGLGDAHLTATDIEPQSSGSFAVPYRHPVIWQGSLFVTPTDEPTYTRWSLGNSCSVFYLPTDRIIHDRSSLPVTGRIALADRLLVFKENSIDIIAMPAPGSFVVNNANTETYGTLSHYSLLALGDVAFFQGLDGHIYQTQGPNSMPLTKGRLDEFVKTLKLNALTATTAFHDQQHRNLIWNVCTGANTTPDRRIIYHYPTGALFTDDSPAAIAAFDRINASYPDGAWLCALGRNLFYDGKDLTNVLNPPLLEWFVDGASAAVASYPWPTLPTSADAQRIALMGYRGRRLRYKITEIWQLYDPATKALADVSAIYESCDWHFDSPTELKSFLTCAINLYAAGNQLRLNHIATEFQPLETWAQT